MSNLAKKIGLLAAGLALAGAAVLPAGTAYAVTPSLFVSTLNGNLVALTVTGDPNSTVVLFYYTNSGTQNRIVGTTDGSGNLYTTADTSVLGVTGGGLTYVLVNGQQSASVIWPTGGLVFGQTNVMLVSGQSANVSVAGGSGGYYIANNSNPGTVGAFVNGSSVTLTALSSGGSATITVCAAGGSACGSLTVSVTGGGSGGLYFSPANPVLAPGATQTITIYGGAGYYLSGNTNPTIVSAYLSGNTLVVASPAGGGYGSAIVTVCQQSSGCGSLTVTVGGAGGGLIVFSPANPVVNYSQSVSVSVFGGSGGYYLSSNSNPSSVGASLTGSTLTLQGLMNGTATITICNSSGGCGSLTATVMPYNTGGGSVIFGQNSEYLSLGQTLSVGLSGGAGPYYLSAGSGNVVQASVSGNTLYLTAISAGTTSVSVCSASNGCGTLSVTVGGTATGGSTDVNSILAELQYLKSRLAALTGGQTVYSGAAAGGFADYMSPGGSGSEVTALQELLARLGLFYGPVTGYYGPLTEAAVQRYQSLHGITPSGTTGPATLAALNLEH